MNVSGENILDNLVKGREGHDDCAELLKLRDRWVRGLWRADWHSRDDVAAAAPRADLGAWPLVRFRFGAYTVAAVIDVEGGDVEIRWAGRGNG